MERVDPKMAANDIPATRRAQARQWFSKVAIDGGVGQVEPLETSRAEAAVNIPSRYEVLSHLGTGGMGIVYKVRDLETGEIVALKILKPGIASDKAMQVSLRNEVCLARKVTHKNVCRIHEFNRSNGTACISMELVEGESLLSKLRRMGSLPRAVSLAITRQICAGLHEAHAQGIVHRDLKPANIMVDRTGNVKIMDFGIARLSQDNGQMTGTIAGTPAYMAPEQLELKPMGPCTDVYSLGLLLYEMVTGTPAFAGETPIAVALKQIRELPKRPSEIVRTVPAGIEAVIMKCLRKDPARRFQSVNELALALEEEAKSGVAAAGSVSPELRLARLEVHHAIEYGLAKARAVVPRFATVAREVERATLEANRAMRQGLKKAGASLRAQDWRGATRTRTMQATAGTLSILLLGGALAFGLAGARNGRASAPTVRPIGAQSFSSPQAALPEKTTSEAAGALNDQGAASGIGTNPAGGAPSNIKTEEVDFSREFNLAPAPDESSSSSSESDMASPEATPTSSVVARSKVSDVKAHSGAHVPKPAPHRTRTAAYAAKISPERGLPLPIAFGGDPPATTDPVNEQLTVDTRPQTASAFPAAPPVPTHKPADAASEKKTEPKTEPKTEQTVFFLEVGSFNDAAWADHAVERLTQLGYHAVSMHRTHLWMQSFHVQVGPYANAKDLEATKQSLTSQGFKPHLVK
jgi:cell division septation protein DedD